MIAVCRWRKQRARRPTKPTESTKEVASDSGLHARLFPRAASSVRVAQRFAAEWVPFILSRIPLDVEDGLQISGRLLTRNWALNLAGQILPIATALVTIPYLIRGLGTERFGILSICWVLLGSSGALDLGLGRATTKFVAEQLGRGEKEKLPNLIWTSLVTQTVIGIGSGLVCALVAPVAVTRLLKISTAVVSEAKFTLLILAGSMPVLLAANTLRGALEATQRFDLVNAIKVPLNICVFLLPAAALFCGLRLPGILCLLALLWLCAAFAYLLCCLTLFPVLQEVFHFDMTVLRPLIVYGGWVQVSNVLNPLLAYVDRIFLASLTSMSAVSYYTAPYDAINRAWVLPGSLTATLFPAFSSLHAEGSHDRLEELCVRALKSVLLTLGPLLLVVMVFARQILQFWLGGEFAAKSTLVLQILAVGALFNAIAVLPFSFLQGLGRPDLTARFHLMELPLYILILWLLVSRMGIVGAALAWTLRVGVDALLLFGAILWLKLVSLRSIASHSIWRTVMAVFLFGALLIPAWASGSAAAQGASTLLLFPVFAAAAWRFVLDGTDRNLILGVAGQVRVALVRTR